MLLPTCRNKQKQSLTVSLYSVVFITSGSGWVLLAPAGRAESDSLEFGIFTSPSPP